MADELLSGDTGKIRMRLAAFEREEHMEGETAPLLARISSYEKEYGISTYSIYQLGLSDNTDNLRFMSLDWLESKGFSVDRDHYQMVYARQREPGETLEDIYRRFNENGADAAYYVDSIGFKELPGFFDAGAPEARRDVSVREQLDNARKQAAQTEPKAPDKRPREPERS